MSAVAADSGNYRIEILIFENLNPVGVDNEQWPSLEDEDLEFDGLSLDRGGESLFQKLSPNSLELVGARNKLDGSGKYRIIYHTGWDQKVASKNESIPAQIEVSGILDGVINIYKQRHLHVDTDLIYNSVEGKVRLNEHRLLKSKELHYFDHPLFGILVRVAKR
jgi:hypothetical protein